MRVVVSEFMSLDGVIQAPGGGEEDTDTGFTHGGWSMPYFDPDAMGPILDEVMGKTQALLFGRRTWQTMAAAWPDRAGDPFADRMNAIKKYVVSRTLTGSDLGWENTELLADEDVASAVQRLRAGGEGDLQVMGSADLAAQLISANLVDEYRLMIEPVLLGGGKRLFPDDGTLRPLALVSTVTSTTGVHICTYQPAASAS